MGAQDKTEKVLREIHVMLSQSEVYDEAAGRVIINKKEMLNLLQKLNVCMYEMMDEHELTQQSRDQAERAARKRGEEIILDANRKAEDVYAASVMYTDEALLDVQDIMQQALESVKEIYFDMEEKMKKEKRRVRTDQSDLKSHLQDLKDTDKYLKIIEDRNREREKAKKKEQQEIDKEMSPYKSIKPEIHINEEFLREHGMMSSLEEETEAMPESNETKDVAPEIKVNLDAEYFQWKENEAKGATNQKNGAANQKKSSAAQGKNDSFMNFLFGKK
ncbi:MAG: hypothetical protein MRZ75_08130 [Roseburia sp.]|uniref:hypothetical protein n=1 Tax=Roseburia sp. 831b TaxID=1261635 RepID=UPI0009535430|nr:hypothetical protein [Roseburia sp. 831b]MCI5919271.1 hypothetical protein [Roseburia sp.]MDY5884652.1 hypothetical protein [Roseburia sp.]WVK72542.1 hypothetical protein BIV16_12425 [Roseburia sp. 831b]